MTSFHSIPNGNTRNSPGLPGTSACIPSNLSQLRCHSRDLLLGSLSISASGEKHTYCEVVVDAFAEPHPVAQPVGSGQIHPSPPLLHEDGNS